MDRARCPTCGEEHDIGDFEPSYQRPDAYLAVPPEERSFRTIAGSDDCRVRDADDTHRRYFLRVLLPIPVRGERETCNWGVWVEVDSAAFERTRELWEATEREQLSEPVFPAHLANALTGYADTIGLEGTVQLTGPSTPPRFSLSADQRHPLVAEQLQGVDFVRVLEWYASHAH